MVQHWHKSTVWQRNCFVSAETNEGRNVLTLCNIRESSLSMLACLVSLKSRENLWKYSTYFILFFLKSDNDVTASWEDDITTKLNFVQDIETRRKMCRIGYKNSF